MKLSLVDQSITPYDGDRKTALKNTIETAKVIEDLGYERMWVAEHHNLPNFAGRTPEVLIAAIAENTTRINVGSGAVLLNHYSPYKVAETFATLCELYPGRIDLGIGRATTGHYSDIALQRDRSNHQTTDNSMEQLVEALAWLTNDFPSDHPFSQVRSYNDGTLPNVFLLGSSGWSAQAAAKLGLAYVYAAFISAEGTYPIINSYRQNFKPSDQPYAYKTPNLTLALRVYTQDTDELAMEFSAPAQYLKRQMQTGRFPEKFPPEKEAMKMLDGYLYNERLDNPLNPPQYIIGKAETVAQELKMIQQAYDADEIIFQIMSSDHAKRLRSLELLATHLL
ncbi:MsnO8 family LLM class oxidoreductase [Chryseobacterium sp. cx-311]|uniref:MsnO8 family LLM class oxidoreductase n=1 Tax=Marnyiella aurantia TaxID=2758037 RepID=UPI001AE8E8F5|nr:MsnO8 family LLM class oxidoreductase [Marnyiella aurantia]MBP0613559.1 MsnO8 family LLM class oxidoreductase [Marnyiella aurantia]